MRLALFGLLLVAACQSPAGEPSEPPEVRTGSMPHVRSMPTSATPAPPMDSLAFLVGRWEGEAFGGWVEEAWGPNQGGTMLGTFRLVNEEGPGFYELLVLDELDGRPTLHVKHFQPDLTPWEEGAESVDFPLIAVQGTTAWFDGLTIHQDGDDLIMYLAMKGKDGMREERLAFRRVAN